MENEKTIIGFIGIGVMGTGMVNNLLGRGFPVLVYSRSKAKAEEVLQNGAQWIDNIADLSDQSQVIITMVGYPKDVEEVYFGENGILANAQKGSYVIDMTTSTPSLAKKIYQAAKEKELNALDAPVSGGDVGARNGQLAIMVGGDQEAFANMEQIFSAMGKNIVLQGKAGAGQHTKMCNQIAIASNMIGVCEAMAYAKKAGLDPTTVLQSIETGAAGSWSLSNLAPRMIAGNFAPGFYIKHFIKDMCIALESAKEMGLLTPGLELAKSFYDELAANGEENSGTQALYKLFAK